MLAIRYQSSFSLKKTLVVGAATVLVGTGGYIASITFSPAIAQAFFAKPIAVSSLSKPQSDNNRLVIPKLGVNVAYGTSSSMLTQDAQWQQADRGNPEDGGTVILAAHRLNIQSTPSQTVRHSPFYALDTLTKDDKLIVDYDGIRYGYQITNVTSGAISDTSIPADDTESRLILYTLDSESDTTRTVITAKPLGKVAL